MPCPGARVRVRFSGRELDGFVVERREQPQHDGRLTPLRRVVSPEPVLTPEVLALCRAVADRYAGTLSDVLRLAVPKRHATAERNLAMEGPPREDVAAPGPGPVGGLPRRSGVAASGRLGGGACGGVGRAARDARATPTGRPRWPSPRPQPWRPAAAALVVVPDHRDVDRLDAALTALLGKGRHVRLTADQGPQARYTAWLKVLRGHVRVVIGTRAAAFAPVHDLGLVAWWDDGDDLLAEPRAPYHHVGVVLGLRAAATGAALLTGGFGRSLRVQVEVEAGALVPVEADAPALRSAAPRVTIAGEGLDEERDGPAARAHIPSRAWRVAKDALVDGPVLVQVPRRGYLPSLSCAECRTPVRCARCQGPVALGGLGHGARLPLVRTGPGRARFRVRPLRLAPAALVDHRREAHRRGDRPRLPGLPGPHLGLRRGARRRRPRAVPRHRHTGCRTRRRRRLHRLCCSSTRGRASTCPLLDAPLEALRRWMAAAALAREGRTVVLSGAPEAVALPAVEALVRWDPAWLAARELAERRELGLPPAVRVAQLTGSRRALEEALGQADLPATAQVLGPVRLANAGAPPRRPVVEGEPERAPADHHVLARVPASETQSLTRALLALKAFRSARKETDVVAVRVDPLDMF